VRNRNGHCRWSFGLSIDERYWGTVGVDRRGLWDFGVSGHIEVLIGDDGLRGTLKAARGALIGRGYGLGRQGDGCLFYKRVESTYKPKLVK
jgi:hypothetical protein